MKNCQSEGGETDESVQNAVSRKILIKRNGQPLTRAISLFVRFLRMSHNRFTANLAIDVADRSQIFSMLNHNKST